MNLKQPFILAAKSLLKNKLRSILTMLGVIIGVAAVIILVGIMDSYKQYLVSAFETIGMNSISVTFYEDTSDISIESLNTLVDSNETVLSGFSPNLTAHGIIKHDNSHTRTNISGVNDMYKELNNLKIKYGDFLNYLDVKDKLNKCVIGSYVYENLFYDNPVGKSICVNGEVFTIVGVVEQIIDGTESSIDNTIYIPYNVLQKMTYSTNISEVSFLSIDKDSNDQATKIIKDYLFSVFKDESAYDVMSMTEMLKMVDELLSMLSYVLVGVASIALLVGGIGIMNIMVVSVTERVKEIGIRKALGATPWDILSQFVVEAITTSAVGGIIGIIMGLEITYVIATMIKMPFVISFGIISIAFGVSSLIGVIFGFLPAYKAAKLDPIEALRYD